MVTLRFTANMLALIDQLKELCQQLTKLYGLGPPRVGTWIIAGEGRHRGPEVVASNHTRHHTGKLSLCGNYAYLSNLTGEVTATSLHVASNYLTSLYNINKSILNILYSSNFSHLSAKINMFLFEPEMRREKICPL